MTVGNNAVARNELAMQSTCTKGWMQLQQQYGYEKVEKEVKSDVGIGRDQNVASMFQADASGSNEGRRAGIEIVLIILMYTIDNTKCIPLIYGASFSVCNTGETDSSDTCRIMRSPDSRGN